MDDLRGLSASILRLASGQDFTLGGISAQVAEVTITGTVQIGGRVDAGTARWYPLDPMARVFAPTESRPEAWLYRRVLSSGEVWAVVPAIEARTGPALVGHLTRLMFGGNFAHLGDSRLSRVTAFYGAVAVHDRVES